MDDAPQSLYEEIANSITHGVGLGLAVAGAAVLIALAALRGTAWHIVAVSVYGGTLILLYGASTLYHAWRHPRAKRVLRVLDHCGIYLLIAGTYTPFTLVSLRGPWGWTLLGLVWGFGLAGIAWKVFFFERLHVLSTALYVIMGWLVVMAIKPLFHAVQWGGLGWLAAGGLFYTLGMIFYASKRRYAHAVWHVMVVGGSACHYVAVMRYVVPA